MSDLAALIERVERLEGPDREVDLQIGAFWPEPRPFDLSLLQMRGKKPTVPRFTASLEAALTFVEKVLPAAQWTVSNNKHHHAGAFAEIVLPHPRGRDGYCGISKTRAIALVLAALRALQEQSNG